MVLRVSNFSRLIELCSTPHDQSRVTWNASIPGLMADINLSRRKDAHVRSIYLSIIHEQRAASVRATRPSTRVRREPFDSLCPLFVPSSLPDFASRAYFSRNGKRIFRRQGRKHHGEKLVERGRGEERARGDSMTNLFVVRRRASANLRQPSLGNRARKLITDDQI